MGHRIERTARVSRPVRATAPEESRLYALLFFRHGSRRGL